MDLGRVGIWYQTDALPSPQAAELVQRVEALGYGAFWFGEGFGRDPLAHAAYLLSQTSQIVIATGIASIYSRDAVAMAGGAHTLAEQSGGRFLLGLGVSMPPLVEPRGHVFGPPVATMRAYLERMKAAACMSVSPEEPAPVVLAALGPRMTALAAAETRGSHPCNVTPEYTARAREAMGGDAWLCVDQKVVLETDPSAARVIARRGLAVYLAVPHQRRHFERMGFDAADFEREGSDRLVDAIVAWGDEEALRARVQAHLDAGASHVCIQPLGPVGESLPDERILTALAPSG